MFDAILDRARTPHEQAVIDLAGGDEAFAEEVWGYVYVSGIGDEPGSDDERFEAGYVQLLGLRAG